MVRSLIVLALAAAALGACRDGNLADRPGQAAPPAELCAAAPDCNRG